ncbi:MAG TPA: hypothetical protein VK124_08545 [Gemmatimonadales bacterium]|nr:hypothetical protein [Gemmatimonadales bacterium]
MPTYSIFGDCLRSEITLPELRRSRKHARWTLRIGVIPPPALSDGAELLGSETVMDGVDVRLYRLANGYRLQYDDTGSFDISAEGREIVWSGNGNGNAAKLLDAVRLDVINRVLPVALHAAGTLCLHGSAVSLNGKAIAFLAPRCHGKSTLALALSQIGGRILTDDALPVEPSVPGRGRSVSARPGVHSVRLFDDTARVVLGDPRNWKRVGAYPLPRRDGHLLPDDQPAITKQILRGIPLHKLMLRTVPLAAIYVLRPVRGDGDRPVLSRTALAPVRAALSLVEHAKSGALLGRSEAPRLLDRAVTIARQVPVYVLEIVRDLSRIDEAARELAGWHVRTNGRYV